MYEKKQALLMHAVVKSLMFAWNLDKTSNGGQGAFKEATTEFYSYFLTNAASDMKTLWERVGLGENLFLQ